MEKNKMEQCILDCAALTHRNELHRALKQMLRLPDWYGENLDALYDCLTDLHSDTELILQNSHALEHSLGHDYALALRQALEDASRENPHFSFTIELNNGTETP